MSKGNTVYAIDESRDDTDNYFKNEGKKIKQYFPEAADLVQVPAAQQKTRCLDKIIS